VSVGRIRTGAGGRAGGARGGSAGGDSAGGDASRRGASSSAMGGASSSAGGASRLGGASRVGPEVLSDRHFTNVSLNFTELTTLLRKRSRNNLVKEATRLMSRPRRDAPRSRSDQQLDSGFLALPTDCLMRVVCCLRHDELQPLLATCR
jgi:hypothetical protein